MSSTSNFIASFFRYLISGGAAVSVQFYVLIQLMEYTPQINALVAEVTDAIKINATISASIAFIVGCFVNYNIQYHWTFKVTGSHKRFLSRYVSVTIVTLGLNAAVFWYFYELVHLSYVFSQFFASGIVFVVNFVINYFFTFKMPKSTPATEAV